MSHVKKGSICIVIGAVNYPQMIGRIVEVETEPFEGYWGITVFVNGPSLPHPMMALVRHLRPIAGDEDLPSETEQVEELAEA